MPSSVKSFVVAAQDAESAESDDEESWPFTVEDFGKDTKTELVAYRPSDGQLAVLMADTTRHASTNTKVAGALNFFDSVLDDAGSSYVRERLLDRKDPFGLPIVQDIIEWLIGEWSGNPTGSRSGSTPSQRSGGARSKPATTRST